jgi:hypothetical protein
LKEKKGAEMIKKLLWIIAVVLLVTNPSAAEDKAEYIIGISKDEGPSTVISLQPLQQVQLKVEVKNKAKTDEKVKDGTKVTTECDLKCAELISIEQSSAPTRDGYAMFTITAYDKAGTQILYFNADGVKRVPVKINVIKPTYTLTIKGAEPGRARDLKIGEDNLIEVEVKEGNAPISDGAEVQAIIRKDEQLFFEGTVINKATTKNGVATFHLTPKDVNGTTTIRFQIQDSFAELKVNISRLSFYQSIVEKTVNQLLGYIAILAAIGTVSMGLLEAFKWNDFIKGKTQGWFLRRHLTTKTANAIAENIIAITYGMCDELRKKLFYRQSSENIILQTNEACEQIIKGIETGDALKDFIDIACPPTIPIPPPDKEEQEKQRRIENLKAYFNAVQLDMNARWKFWNQVAATVISVLIIGLTLLHYYPSVHSVKIFVLSFFGGLLAPMAKDFANSAASIINKLKGS